MVRKASILGPSSSGGVLGGVKKAVKQGGAAAGAKKPLGNAFSQQAQADLWQGRQPAAPQAPARNKVSQSGAPQQTFSSSIGGGPIGGMSPTGVVEPPKDMDWLRANDGEFTAAEAAYKNVYDQLAATLSRENSNYEQDYGTALQNLGWIDPDGADGPGVADWAMNNVDTAAGRSYRSLFDDHAGRGMLQGTAFGESENSLRTSLDKQRDMLDEQKGQFTKSQTERQTQAQQTRDNSIKLAAAQALARVASGLGI